MDKQLTKEALRLNVALMLVVFLGPKNVAPTPVTHRWLPLARMIEATGYTAIDGIRNFETSQEDPLGTLDHSNHKRGSLHHLWDNVPDTWRPHELLLMDWLKWHANAKGRCEGGGSLCMPIIPRSWFTLPEVCRTSIVKCTVESSNSVHCEEILRLLCHYVVNT